MPSPSDVPSGPTGPNVYLPHSAETPSYEEYADPAAAHGWQVSAYDETRELPRLAREPEAGGRADRRRARRRATGWRSRRGVVAAGAVGAVSVAALVAGLSSGGSPSGGGSGSGPTAGTLSASEGATPSGPPSGTGTPTTTRSSDPGSSGSGDTPPSPSPGTSAPEQPPATASPSSPASPSTSAPTSDSPSPSWTSGRGSARGKGWKRR
ncbi:hypothetical protein AQJ30_29115 [Streptomyces longwoodensis]|uniref:Uncharacterized protein n=1 Tax=Streptomyces longwoodensis TaxID=68231 RepID=A0A101QQR6_9ACTN|nr:hypothetical protein [Streptomyces longwoodensis]KUN34365.1 hypothetical protein AQJ30_29115 [Streptomyces longwoodensis]